jgi:hypothetical protein
MLGALRSMSKIQKEAVLDIAVLIALTAFVIGYASCAYVKYERAEADRFEKITFCHDMMKDGKTLHWWRKEYCEKKSTKLRAVDPISGRPVMGVIEGDEK